ncbi:MAG: hypothetical protein NTW29_20555 [Bacteroidetes bacterium]|nr:hypothetical protein [Bacteroidota bacterium]
MNRYVKALIPALIVAAGTYVYIISVLNKKRPDNYIGTYLIKPAGDVAQGKTDRIVPVIQKRLEHAGYPVMARVLQDGTAEFTVQKMIDTVQIIELLTKRGVLQFRPGYTKAELFTNLEKARAILLAENSNAKRQPVADTPLSGIDSLVAAMEKTEKKQEKNEPEIDPLLDFFEQQNGITNSIGLLNIRDTARLRSLLNRPEVRTGSLFDPEYYYGEAIDKPNNQGIATNVYLYAVNRDTNRPGTLIENSDLDGAQMDIDYTNQVVVNITFNGHGARLWAKMTEENINKPIAMIIDGEVMTAPIVIGRIEGRNTSISGNFTPAEARALAEVLSLPPLPVQVQLLSAKLQKLPKTLSTKEILTILGAFVLAFGIGLFVIKTFEQNK